MTHAARITSAASDRVKAVRALHAKQGRRSSGRFAVEGPQAVRSALAAGVVVHEIFVADGAGDAFPDIVAAAQSAGCRVTPTSQQALAAMAETQHPQGVLAVCDLLPPGDLDALMAGPGPIVVLEGVSDPGNVGTIIRTADAAGAGGVVLTPGSADVHNGKVVRSTAGSLFHLPVLPDVPLAAVADAARRHDRALVVTAGDGDEDLFAAADGRLVCGRTCWVIGSEAHGASPEARAAADLLVRIPMAGAAESLNAAVATAVVLYVTAHAGLRSGDSNTGSGNDRLDP